MHGRLQTGSWQEDPDIFPLRDPRGLHIHLPPRVWLGVTSYLHPYCCFPSEHLPAPEDVQADNLPNGPFSQTSVRHEGTRWWTRAFHIASRAPICLLTRAHTHSAANGGATLTLSVTAAVTCYGQCVSRGSRHRTRRILDAWMWKRKFITGTGSHSSGSRDVLWSAPAAQDGCGGRSGDGPGLRHHQTPTPENQERPLSGAGDDGHPSAHAEHITFLHVSALFLPLADRAGPPASASVSGFTWSLSPGLTSSRDTLPHTPRNHVSPLPGPRNAVRGTHRRAACWELYQVGLFLAQPTLFLSRYLLSPTRCWRWVCGQAVQ